MGTPEVYVCRGKSCREDRRAFAKLVASLDGVARLRRVKCQKICEGPVAGTQVDGALEWFEALDTGKRRAALRRLLETGEVGRRLKRRRVAKRRGKLKR